MNHNPERVAQVRAVERRCKGPRETDAAGHPIGDLRKGCGADFNKVVLAHPFDGKERTTSCPQCGVETTWCAPRFD